MASWATNVRQTSKSPESFESQQRRENAVEILQSYEKLSWVSLSRHESIAQTRFYLRKIIAGFKPENDEPFWKEDLTPHETKDDDQPWSNRKGKQRMSAGGGSDVRVKPESSNSRHAKEKPRPSTGKDPNSSSRKRQGSDMQID